MLTDAQCRNATCPPDKKRARVTDAAGLYLEISPAGSKRWFWKTYADGKEGRLSLGSYPSVSLGDARKARDAAKLQRDKGFQCQFSECPMSKRRQGTVLTPVSTPPSGRAYSPSRFKSDNAQLATCAPGNQSPSGAIAGQVACKVKRELI